MSAIEKFAERARSVARTIVLPEGQDPRVVVAANKAMAEKVCAKVIVLGSEAEIADACAKGGVTERLFESLDYMASPLLQEYANQLYEKRKAKGLELEKAVKMMSSRIYFSSHSGGVCHTGTADGLNECFLDDTVLNVEGELARALLRCTPAHTVGVCGNVGDLFCLNPLALFGNGSRTVITTLVYYAHMLNFKTLCVRIITYVAHCDVSPFLIIDFWDAVKKAGAGSPRSKDRR